jgi:hypothetical protein
MVNCDCEHIERVEDIGLLLANVGTQRQISGVFLVRSSRFADV